MWKVIWLSIALAACSVESDTSPATLPDPTFVGDGQGTRYVNAPRTHQILLSNGTLFVGPTEEHARRLLADRGEAHTSSFSAIACSDERMLCLAADRFAFAIPRDGVVVGQSYETQGARFVVQRCNDTSCNEPTIRATCEKKGPGVCASIDEQVRSSQEIALLEFTYRRHDGVVSINVLPDGDLAGQRSYALVEGPGILSSAN